MCRRRLETRWQRWLANTLTTVRASIPPPENLGHFHADGMNYGFPGDQWSELLGVLFQASQSTEPGLRETAFRIFTTTPSIIEKQHEGAVLGVFTKGFKDDNIAVSCVG